MNEPNYLEWVTDALRVVRQDNLIALAQNPLALPALEISPFLWQSNQPHGQRPETAGQALLGLLRWATECLMPAGAPSWTATPWRSYHILNYIYWQQWRWSRLGGMLALSEARLYECRDQAVQQVAEIIAQEFRTAQYSESRRQLALGARYQALTPDQQHLMRAVAVFAQHVRQHSLREMLSDEHLDPLAPRLQLLEQLGLIFIQDGLIHCQNLAWRDYLRGLLSTPERAAWFSFAAQQQVELGNYFAAAQLYRTSGQKYHAQYTVGMLWQARNKLFESGQASELLAALQAINGKELDAQTEAQRQLLIGLLANQTGELKVASESYRLALSAPLPNLRARAYYQRGRLLRKNQLDEALLHFERAIQLLAQQSDFSTEDRLLLGQLYIDCAWIYIQERPNPAAAQQALQAADRLYQQLPTTSIDESRQATDIANALGEYHFRQGQFAEAANQHYRAWLLANEVQEAAYLIKTSFNLARDYTVLAQYPSAFEYLQICAQLAKTTQNVEMAALCEKAIGNYHFMQGDYRLAIDFGLRAWQQAQQHELRNWQASVGYDLAEAFILLGDSEQANYYWHQACDCAKATGNAYVQAELLALQAKAPQLGQVASSPLQLRYQQLVTFVQAHGRINNREYRDLTQISQKQAARDFSDLIEAGLLQVQGQGRSTCYTLNAADATPTPLLP